MYRLFIAIDFPEAIKTIIHSLCLGLKDVKWTTEEQIHLTIRFIGDADGRLLDDILSGLSRVESNSFYIKLKSVGNFPLRGSPKVLWAGVEKKDKLEKLYRIINNSMKEIGIDSEHRKFAPHITLGRIKKGAVKGISEFLLQNNEFETEKFLVDQFHLYSSKLTPKGAIHEKLASFDLKKH